MRIHLLFLFIYLELSIEKQEFFNIKNDDPHNCIHDLIDHNPQVLRKTQEQNTNNYSIAAENERVSKNLPLKFKPIRIHFDYTCIFLLKNK